MIWPLARVAGVAEKAIAVELLFIDNQGVDIGNLQDSGARCPGK